jgi:hypothetical protein
VNGVAGDGQLDAAAVFVEESLSEGDVGLADGAFLKGFGELRVSEIVFGDEENAGGFLVEAMDDAGAERILGLRERLAAAEESVDEGALGNSCAGVNGHASGFVDSDEVIVFVEDIEGDGLRLGFEGRTGQGVDLDRIAGADFVGVLGGLAVEEDEVLFDEFLDAGAGEFGAMEGNEAIETEAGFGGGDFELKLRGAVHTREFSAGGEMRVVEMAESGEGGPELRAQNAQRSL